jgi:mevalonate kinase
VASAPGKVILVGEHGVHRGQPNIVTAVGLRTLCRATPRHDSGYSFASGPRREQGTLEDVPAFKARVDRWRQTNALDEIAGLNSDFFAPARYVLATLAAGENIGGVNLEWRSAIPIGSGLGSGAAAFTSMVLAISEAYSAELSAEDVIFTAWQGDIIAHGGYGSSMDSTTCTYGGLIRYTKFHEPEHLKGKSTLPLVIADTLVAHRSSEIHTHMRLWLQERPVRMRVFEDMGYLIHEFIRAWEIGDLEKMGHIMNLHQLIQEKMLTSCSQSEVLIEAARGAGALGAKVSGTGRGGIIIALTLRGREREVADAIDLAGGKSYIVPTSDDGVRIEPADAWEAAIDSSCSAS